MRLATAAALVLSLGASISVQSAEPWARGPGIALSKGELKLALTGYVQLDGRAYSDWEVQETDLGALRHDETELRRLRMGFELTGSRFEIQVQADPHEDGRSVLKDAYAELRFGRGFRVRAGHFKVPVSPEFLTSAAKTDFVERSLLAEDLGPGRDFGVMAHGDVGDRLTYQVGAFAGDGWSKTARAGTTAAARVVVTPSPSLSLGVSGSFGHVNADPAAPDVVLVPRGFDGNSATGYEYFVPHFADGRRTRIDLEASFAKGPIIVKAEALRARDQRKGQSSTLTDLPDLEATGWAASTLWLIRGSKRREPGALEVGTRYESLRFDDTGDESGFEGLGNRTRNVKPVSLAVWTSGLSLWVTRWGRIMGDVVLERYGEALVAPEPGRKGSYVSILGRLQVHLP